MFEDREAPDQLGATISVEFDSPSGGPVTPERFAGWAALASGTLAAPIVETPQPTNGHSNGHTNGYAAALADGLALPPLAAPPPPMLEGLRGPALLDSLQRFSTQHEKWLKRSIAIWLASVFVLSGVTAFGALQYMHFRAMTDAKNGKKPTGFFASIFPEAPSIPPETYFGKSQLLFVLTGVDEVEFMGRTDTIMVALIDFRTDQLKLLSIPRDTVVPFGKSFNKINAAAGWKRDDKDTPEKEDLDNMADVLSNFLTVPIDNIVAVNYEGFKQIIDAVGGVTIDVPKRMKYTDRRGHLNIDFDPGIQHLDGQKALEFARFRHDATGDFGRIERQQMLIKELKAQKLNAELLASIPALVPAVQKAIQTQHPLTMNQVKALAAWSIGLEREDITVATIPTELGMNGRLGSYLVPQYDATEELLHLYFSDQPLESVGPPVPDPETEESVDPR